MGNLQLKRPLVVLDIESTGLNPNEDRIVQIAWQKHCPDGQVSEGDEYLNPERPISAEATEVHGIRDEDVRGCPTFKEKAQYFHDLLSGCDLTGFGIRRFDVPMLMCEFQRVGLSLDFPLSIIDTMEIYHKREPRDLTAAVARFTGDPYSGTAHNAKDDVAAAWAVLRGQLEQFSDLPEDVEGLAAASSDPNAVDIAGKLARKGELIVLTFGKHMGKALNELPLDYLQWMRTNNVLGPDVKDLLGKAMQRGFAIKNARRKYS